jgi:hypothetical protein
VDKVSPQLLETLGVVAEIQEMLLDASEYWGEILTPVDSGAGLRLNECLLRPSGIKSLDRSVLPDAWLKEARLRYCQGRHGKALATAGRAVLVHL